MNWPGTTTLYIHSTIYFVKIETRGVSHYGLAIYIKKVS
jgi:hypothetical protein